MTHTNTEGLSDERLAELDNAACDQLARNPNGLWQEMTAQEARYLVTQELSRRAANSAGGVRFKQWHWDARQPGMIEHPEGAYVLVKDVAAYLAPSPAVEAEPVAPVRYFIEHDGFVGTVIGRYTRLDGKKGVVMQQDGTNIVHVYGTKWLKPAGPPHPSSPVSAEVAEAWWPEGPFKFGDRVEKPKGSSWHGKVCGWYTTSLTPVGYCVESEREPGSVQLYPDAALAALNGGRENG